MSLSLPLVPRIKSDAERNLANFIQRAKQDLTMFGVDLDFDSDSWNVRDYYVKKGQLRSTHGAVSIFFCQRLREGAAEFCPQLKEFAKAYVRTKITSQSPSAITHLIAAFRALDTAIQALHIETLSDCDANVFNRAAEIIRSRGTNQANGYPLAEIARTMDELGLVYAPLHNWKFMRSQKPSGRLGFEFERSRKEKMPSPEALDGLAKAFHLASDPRDVLITAVAAIMCSAPERINEVMQLQVDCIVEEKSSDGRTYLGLRWVGSKGAPDHIKWVLPGMADVVREAITRIRQITEPARAMARWYEQNPSKLYLSSEHQHLRDKAILTLDEIGSIINLTPNRRCSRSWIKSHGVPTVLCPSTLTPLRMVQAVRFVDLERYVLSTLPDRFPICDPGRGLKYSDSLLIFSAGLFGRRGNSGGSTCMFESIQYHHVGCALGQNRISGCISVFERVGIDPEGKLSIRSHQLRHWLNTLAQGANLSQIDIAKWSGRANVSQNTSYDHVTSEEILSKIRDAVGDSVKAIGPLAEIPPRLPVTRAEFAALTVPTAHVTLYGFCIHDYTSAPCEKFRQCLDCREQICVKGMPDKTARISLALESAQVSLAKATQAVLDGVYGAEEWESTHRNTVDRLKQLMSILNDPLVQDGAVIQLSQTGTRSSSEETLLDRLRVQVGSETKPPSNSRKKLPQR